MKKNVVFIFICFICFFNIKAQTNNNFITDSCYVKVSRLLINNLLNRPTFMMYNTSYANGIHYAEACTGFGAARVAGLLNDTALLNKIAQRYSLLATGSMVSNANHVDISVFGILPLELYRQNLGNSFLNQGMLLANNQWSDTLDNGITYQARYWIDDIWMVASLQVQAYRVTGNDIYLNRAAMLVNEYIKKLQQPNGLFYHGANGPFYWGRGNGWVAAGMAEILTELPQTSKYYNTIHNGYVKMMQSLIFHQSANGMWRQIIDNNKSFYETSATAMFGYAMSIGVKKGLLQNNNLYNDAILKAWQALVKYIDNNGNLHQVCEGTGQSFDVNYYLNRERVAGDLHGQAPMLWFAYSLMANY